MTRFMYLFRGGADKMADLSSEEKQAHMQAWGAWMQGLAEKKILLDGCPLSTDGKQVQNRGEIVSDGPYAEGKEIVGGYLIVNAASVDNAVEISTGCPIFEVGGAIEVREIMKM